LLALPPIQSVKERTTTSKLYATIDPFVLKEWKAERTKLIDEINQNPFARFDEETLRLFNLSNYLLSLRLQEIETPAKHIAEFFAIWTAYKKDYKFHTENLQRTDENVRSFFDELNLPKSVLNISLLIQFYAVPLSDKLDGAVFARHFTQ
jgi:hypothetical protein